MISEKKLEKTIELARAYNAEGCKYSTFSLDKMQEMMENVKKIKPYRDALESHLNSLSYDDILDLEGLMDYGRDLDLKFVDIFAKKYFEERRDFFAKNYPSPNGKEEAVRYLVGKGPLAEYLERAAKALELL